MRDGLTLSDQSLPAGWKWLNPDKKLEVGSVSAYAVYTPADTRNYYKEIRTIGFTVYKEDPASGGSGGSGSDNHNGSDCGSAKKIPITVRS